MPDFNIPTPDSSREKGGLTGGRDPRFAIFISAFNAASKIGEVLGRIPQCVWDRVEEVYLFDDCSQDETAAISEGFKESNRQKKLTIHRNEYRLGNGGSQKKGFDYAIERGFDFVILLHGDGQYDPEMLPSFIASAEGAECAVVLGSRTLPGGCSPRGVMPLYKIVGNRLLTCVFNALLGSSLSEFFCGYRMYSVNALRVLNYKAYSDDLHFDTNILIEALHRKLRILELPVPAHHGKEIGFTSSIRYARDSSLTVLQYIFGKNGLVRCDWGIPTETPYKKYRQKTSALSSHRRIASMVPPGSKVLDLGSEGNYVDMLRAKGCIVTGVNTVVPTVEMLEQYASFLVKDLEVWRPPEGLGDGKYDCVIMADVLEHLRGAKALLSSLRPILSEGGTIIASTGNIANWYIRLALLFGSFTYRERGILDSSHVHLYTGKSFRALIRGQGYEITGSEVTPIPFELLSGSATPVMLFWKTVEHLYYALARLWPGMFAYQFVIVAAPKRDS